MAPTVWLATGTPGAAAAAPCSAGLVSLTFDDGPASVVTPSLVRMLRGLEVPATFFMVGARVATAPATARLVAGSGFQIANHSYRHELMTRQSSGQIKETLRATDRALRALGIRPTNLMRPPYGGIDGRVGAAIADAGFTPVLWDVDPRDWDGGSSSTIANRILAQLTPHGGNVVLQHDGIRNSPASIAAVPRVVREARRRGYCFAELDATGRSAPPVPRARVSVTDVDEGGRVTATVRLDRPTSRWTSVVLSTRSLTARAGSDYASRRVRITFAPGSVRSVVRVRTLRDRLDERTERFVVGLRRPRHLTLGHRTARVALRDTDEPPGISLLGASVAEPVGADVVLPVTLRLDRVSGRTVSVVVRTGPGTADATDFVPLERTATLPAGVREITVDVTIRADAIEEPDEAFTLDIVSARHATVRGPAATLTITPPVPDPRS